MVAYSFKNRFAAPILAGAKLQTIRADRRRHARAGEELQLYTGMRTIYCRLLGKATCLAIVPVTLVFSDVPGRDDATINRALVLDLDAFARDDGFADWQELKAFWRENHPGVDKFEGWLIRWGDLR